MPASQRRAPVQPAHEVVRALADERATAALAGRIAAEARAGDFIALEGDLGVGKTTFARAFLAARAGAPIDAPSPTFTLVQVYDLAGGTVVHVDLYRVSAGGDLAELGLEDYLATSIVILEWPDRLGAAVPADRLVVRLAFADAPEARRATLIAHGTWTARLDAVLA
jgi:tRNA threonylcarbamoyl adenosine modification protein YjeE